MTQVSEKCRSNWTYRLWHNINDGALYKLYLPSHPNQCIDHIVARDLPGRNRILIIDMRAQHIGLIN